jgi:hypothetical protein
MGRLAKAGIVIAGYVAAIVAGVVAARLYDAWAAAQPYDTSGGMYAGGEMLQSLAAFLLVSLVPTALGLWFLRRNTRFWNAVAVASLAFAGVGLMAVLLPLVYRGAPKHIAIMLLDLLGLSQLLGVPLWFVAFVLFAFLAPTREARRKLVLAVGIEAVIGVCALVHWFSPGPPPL